MTTPSLYDHCCFYQKYILMFPKTLMERRCWLLSALLKLHHPLCPNPNIITEAMTEMIDIYWKEFSDFGKKSGIFANQSNFFNKSDAF